MERDAVGGTKRARHYRKKEAGDLDEASPSTSDTRADRRERSRSRSRSTSPPAQPPIGRVLRGSVQSVRDFGVFVRLEGYARDGLLHISQVADERLTADDLRSRFKPGAKVWVKVSSISADGKVGLTARRIDQATGKPVDAPARSNAHAGASNRAGVPEPIGPPPELFSIHRATVVSSTDFAVFVRLLPSNHDAMVHTTQLEEDRLRAANAKVPADVYANGSSVWVKVSAVDGYSKKAKLQARAPCLHPPAMRPTAASSRRRQLTRPRVRRRSSTSTSATAPTSIRSINLCSSISPRAACPRR